MKKIFYFEGLPQIGNLYLEHVLLSFENEPIVFVCSDKDMKIFLCLCSEVRNIQRWILSKSNVRILEDLIDGKIDIYSALEFQLDECKYLLEFNSEGTMRCDEVLFNEIDQLDLPIKSTFLKYFDEDSARKSIEYIKEKQKIEKYLRNITYNINLNDLNSSYQHVFQSYIEKILTNDRYISAIEKDQSVNTTYSVNSQDMKQSHKSKMMDLSWAA